MTKERKEQIIDDYIKDIKFYLNVGLCEGQANGSFGEDLMRHFDIIAECFKETTLIEHDLGIDLITLYKIMSDGFYVKRTSGYIAWCMPSEFMLYKDGMSEGWECPTKWFFKDYGKTWALTKEELK